jgi:hypothetical protein
MTGTYAYAAALAEKIEAAGYAATCDPRSATPPCVLFEMPILTPSTRCRVDGQYYAVALAPGTANADAWVVLEELFDAIRAAVPYWIRAEPVRYSLSPDTPALPAWRVSFTYGVEV